MKQFRKEIFDYLMKLEELSKKQFGDPKNPLLVSVRLVRVRLCQA